MDRACGGRFAAPVYALMGVYLSLVATQIVSSKPTEKSTTAPERGHKLPIFDFDNYKRLFKRNYLGLEELTRRNNFNARAVRVAIAAIKYQNGEMSYFLAINRFSDATQEELDMMRNRVLEEELVTESSSSEHAESVEQALPAASKQRKKRDVPKTKTEKRRRRRLPMRKLINIGDDAELEPDIGAEAASSLPGRNKLYKPYELPSCGLRDEQSDIEIVYDCTTAAHQSELGLLQDDEDSVAIWESLPDVEFSDLRRGGCFLSPRHQESCGACYAFAFVTVLEWLYCKKTGKLVAFSEQYMIDCGLAYVDGLDGCNGGHIPGSAEFVHNFGLELHRNYPYMSREQQCPYSEDEPLNATGYIRPNFGNLTVLQLSLFDEYLERFPILTNIKVEEGFLEYGGGVFDIQCDNDRYQWSLHTVVVVGHGREGGKEYWLIRNSHSTGWGERGYYKLAKKASCINGKFGVVYGTDDGINIVMNVDNNPMNDNKRIREAIPKPLNQMPLARSKSVWF